MDETQPAPEVQEQDVPASEDTEINNELLNACAGEFLSAFERKDKKGILESLRAIIMSME